MRLHHLTVTAFGPFPGTEQVDFEALSQAGLFLFTGPTGAGKTSVLDAVCFALYGQVPGARQQARALRSDHAAPGERPEVTLVVTLRGRRLRITRSPAWDRPKRRGDGTTVENARVLLEQADRGGWVTLSTRLDEAGQLLGRLLGLSLAQFCQVVLLPQGQFAEFLRADADRRRDLLETLFDTRRFTAVEAWLVTRRQLAARRVDELDQQVGRVLARVAQAAGVDAATLPDPGVAPAWVEERLTTARRDRTAAAAASSAVSGAAAAAVAALAEAERVRELVTRRSVLQARLDELGAAQPARAAAGVELEAARRVAPLLPLLAETGRLQTRLEELRAAVTARHAALRTALPATGTDGPVRASLPPARAVLATARTALARAAELTALAHQEREADRLAQDNDTLARRAVEIGGLVAEAAEWLEAAPSRRAELVTARDAAHDARARLGDAAAARDRAVARVAAAARRDDLAQRLVALADALRARTDDHQAALARLQDVRERRLAGMAAELAGRLSAGSDCPVCGSPEHPRPAQPGADPVTRELEDALRADAAAADVTRQQAAAALAAAEAELAAAREAAGGDGAAAELGAAAQDLEEVAARLARLAAEAPAAEAALASFDRDREQWLRQRVALDEEARVLATRVREQRQRVDQLTALLGRARGDDASVSAGARRLEALSRDLDGLAEQLAEMEQLDGAVAEALARAEAEVHRRRLASIDEVAAAARDDDQMAALERFCLDHDTELGSVTEQLAEPALATAPDAAPDLEPLRAAVAGATARRDAALTTGAAADRRVTELERLRRELADVLAERGPVADAQRTVDRLSRLAEGKSADNRLRMSLSAYVLAARLEQVAASASSRLLRMTSGRYSLLHAATSGTGRGRGGLALRVLDAWTGQERDPATLSGGESFSASLALALGLADVVTAEAGGALLETLFVDEGFGSLDEDTLDEVMNVLDDLRDGGRTVGLVSHVADLRQRIPVQLAVAKGRRGSVIRQ